MIHVVTEQIWARRNGQAEGCRRKIGLLPLDGRQNLRSGLQSRLRYGTAWSCRTWIPTPSLILRQFRLPRWCKHSRADEGHNCIGHVMPRTDARAYHQLIIYKDTHEWIPSRACLIVRWTLESVVVKWRPIRFKAFTERTERLWAVSRARPRRNSNR